ncbi:protein FAR1-RELATED SEQUENCE 5-like [Panicum virgatum]|uniref:protein FAR1-RELATED SEQUENCE 5-like n=1 Tax=Panicum virgatum TaxID=38727 RepID=UPI0019D67729|nr:protein FAR1-RELATED SEQUENCE 5-like [Panicum virgatum]
MDEVGNNVTDAIGEMNNEDASSNLDSHSVGLWKDDGDVHMDDGFRTPMKKTKKTSVPKVGMIFDDVESAEKFYKDYAHDIGFAVRIGQQKLDDNGLVQCKRYLCARQGFRSQKAKELMDPSKKVRHTRETRCGCEAYMYVKRDSEGKYHIAALFEDHNHDLVTPSKLHLLRSKRLVSEKEKATLFNCHKASIGTSQAFRLLQVGAGGFEYVGCTKKDLLNYYSDFRNKIKNADAQMFIDQFGRLKEVDPGFFFEYEVNDGRLVRVFWADATSRKNYIHFGDVLSFDSTYSTNQYDMKFAPFTGVNHHMQSIFFGAGFLADEKIESFTWLFQTFLRAMGGKAPELIITDEDASMRAAIGSVLPNTIHRLCVWHIMKKFPKKIGPHLLKDEEFLKRVNSCVWGSETTEEFERKWHAIMSDYHLENNEWLDRRYQIRQSWIPAYFKDIWLGGILRTTSRSESANSFFNRFIGRKLSLVEFWLRFDTALQFQRQEELLHDNTTMHTNPTLFTSWEIEKHGSFVFTHEVFNKFQEEVLAAREHCDVQNTTELEDRKIVAMTDNYRRPTSHTRQEEQENFIGFSIPDDVQVHPPTDILAKGKCKRILGHADKNKKKKEPTPRKCTTCKDVGHDRRNCPNKES